MFTIFDVAVWFLSKENMTQKKLQKLCYYAQAWHWALFEEPLINDRFQAWVHGPVNETLWNKTTCFGYDKISPKDLNVKVNELPAETIDFLEDIYFTYGEYDGTTLEELTHHEEPWLNQRKDLNKYEPSKRIISNADMINYYRKKSLVDVNTYAKAQTD